MRGELHQFREAISQQTAYWPRAFRLLWSAAPRWIVLWISLLLVQGLLPALTVYLTKLLVDALARAHSSGGDWEQAKHILILLALTGTTLVTTDFINSVLEWVRVAQSEKIQEHIRGLIHTKSVNLDLAFYETPEYLDLLDQTRSEAGSRPVALLETFGSLLQNSVTLLAMAAMLFAYGPLLTAILLLSTLPAFYVVLRYERSHYSWWQQMTPDRRWAQYFDTLLTHSDSAAEIRLFDVGGYFVSRYKVLRTRLINQRLLRMRQLILKKSAASIAALLISGLAIALVGWRVVFGPATLGDLALFYGAFSRGQALMRSLLSGASQILSNSLYLKHLFNFFDLESKITEPEDPTSLPPHLISGISMKAVTFTYPGGSRPALHDFNLDIPAGQVVALVGANGAGKSTVLKLLCRLYDIDEGSIQFDGIDVRNVRLRELRRMITTLFQFPVQYHTSAQENIALGDLSSVDNRTKVINAAQLAGAHDMIVAMPDGYDSILGKWFVKGQELSGGEWQRIALSRAYVRNSEIIILDEPTSFMDSWSEAEWFNRFRRLAAGRTAIVITHRFTIAMRADVIHVMDSGKIVESGSHRDLLEHDGLYAQSWLSQMQAGVNASAMAI